MKVTPGGEGGRETYLFKKRNEIMQCYLVQQCTTFI